MKSLMLDNLYNKYDISSLTFGKIHDKLGDLYEEYCATIISSQKNLLLAQKNSNSNDVDFEIFMSIMKSCRILDFSEILDIEATTIIPHRKTHGLSKTDIIMTIKYVDGHKAMIPISCKQSYAPKIAFAEFDVETICTEMEIKNARLKYLLLKHQKDKSAKFFTPAEKAELKSLIAPIREELVRWVVTGCKDIKPSELVFPSIIIKIKLKKPANRNDIHIENGDLSLIDFSVCTSEEYIKTIIFDKNGNVKSGGFGTGLSWTYATGSAGYKIQFKA